MPGAASRWWLHYSLQSLSANLQNVGNSLLIRIGQTQAVLLDLLSRFKNSHVFWNRSCEPAALESEHRILSLLEAKKVQGTGFYGNNLVDPASIKTQTQKPYRVFTPFWKRLQSQLPLSPPLPAPKTLPPPPTGNSNPTGWISFICFRRLTGHRVSVKVGPLEKRGSDSPQKIPTESRQGLFHRSGSTGPPPYLPHVPASPFRRN